MLCVMAAAANRGGPVGRQWSLVRRATNLARAKGVTENKVIYKHAFKAALVTVIPVIGIQAVGGHVAELAGEAVLAVETAATVEDIAGTIHAHPTLGESLMEAALGLAGRPIHTR